MKPTKTPHSIWYNRMKSQYIDWYNLKNNLNW